MSIKEFFITLPIPLLIMIHIYSYFERVNSLNVFAVSLLSVYCLIYRDLISENK